MNWRTLLYATACIGAMLYLAIANASGYIPFASPTNHTNNGTANHFHK